MSEIEIELNGKVEALRCTLKAAKQVNAGIGFMNVLGRLSAMDQDYYFLVVAAGLGKKIPEVEDAVFEAGLPNLTEPLSNYVTLLANGGRLPGPEDQGTGKA